MVHNGLEKIVLAPYGLHGSCYDCGRDLKGEGIHTCKDIKRRIDARREMFDYNTL